MKGSKIVLLAEVGMSEGDMALRLELDGDAPEVGDVDELEEEDFLRETTTATGMMIASRIRATAIIITVDEKISDLICHRQLNGSHNTYKDTFSFSSHRAHHRDHRLLRHRAVARRCDSCPPPSLPR